MKNGIIITFVLLVFVLTTALATWFEEQSRKIDAINKQYDKDIKKMQTIAQINLFLNRDIIPLVGDEQNNSIETDKKLIYFFDENHNRYNLLVDKYIYEDDFAKNIDMSYAISRGSKEALDNFVNIEHKDGFLQFRELKLDAKELSGKFQVAQPYNVENNLSQGMEAADNVPQ